ncbi:hypothetical protein [Brevibacillus gelatini]
MAQGKSRRANIDIHLAWKKPAASSGDWLGKRQAAFLITVRV